MRNYPLLVTSPEELHDQLDKMVLDSQANYLVQVCSTQNAQLSIRYSQLLGQTLPVCTIIGQSTTNVIFRGEIYDRGTLIIITELKQTTLTSSVIPLTGNHSQDSQSLVHSLDLKESSQSVISFADGITAGDFSLYQAFNHLDTLIPVSGGVSVKSKYGHWVMLNQTLHNDAIVAVAMHGDKLQSTYGSFNEWNPIGRRFVVTESHNNRVISLNGISAVDIYNRYLADGQQAPLSDIVNFPLMRGVKSEQNLFSPTSTYSDGSIEFDRQLSKGSEVRFSYNHPSLTIEQVQLEAIRLNEFNPDSIFIYNCTSRLDFMEGNEELQPFLSLGSVNGTYCSGEICRDRTRQTILHHSMTYLAIKEKFSESESDKIYLDKSHTISPLFSLIRNAITDVDMMHSELEEKYVQQAKALTESYRIDQRTNLLNRSVLKERLSEIRLNEHLITMKLNNFPQINEKYGYDIGDQLLMDISRYCESLLQKALGRYCTLYSIGTGEWAAVFSSDLTGVALKKKISEFAEQIEHVNFDPANRPELGHLSVAVSVGVTSRRDYPNISPDRVLLKSIEARRFATKHNRHVFSAKQLEKENDNRQSQLEWLSCVSRAVLNDSVVTFAQPILEAHSHKEIAVECLVRIRDEGKIISPGQFLPIIEGTHLYTRLSRQMIKHTFSVMKNKTIPFSINLSPQDLMNDKTILLLERCLLAIKDPSRVGLEVLETEQIHDYGRMIEVCNHLRSLGARIIIDDFGSGYSNIDEIIKLEPQIVKIDGSLIRSIDTDQRQRKVAQTLIQLCEVLGAKTVAEFVHNEAVCIVAEDLGVDYLQGFYLGKPYEAI